MKLSRRGFLGGLLATAAVAALPKTSAAKPTKPSYLPKESYLGCRCRDPYGNEFVLCALSSGIAYGDLVGYDTDFTASQIGRDFRGRLGVAMVGSESTVGWVQIYGVVDVKLKRPTLTYGLRRSGRKQMGRRTWLTYPLRAA